MPHLAKHSMSAIQVAEILPQRYEELRGQQPTAVVHHGDGAQFPVFDPRSHLGLEETVVLSLEGGPQALSLVPRSAGVAGLGYEVSLHGVEETEVVVLDFAELEEVEAAARPLFRVQVDHYIS